MIKVLSPFFIFLSFYSNFFAQKDPTFNVQYFNTVPKISIRALEVISDNNVWFAANRGVWGYTEDAGKNWHIDSLKVDSIYPQFRSIAALNDSTLLLLSIGSPAYLFKTTNKGKTWKLVYKNTEKAIFFDSMLFYDKKNGIAISDPIDHCIQIITTHDAGETWQQLNCENIPKAEQGEACFATSNTNVDVYKNNLWFVTGGKRSRVFHSPDMGKHFETFDSPIPQGQTMTGIFSFDFFNDQIGMITGGNYDKTDSSIVSLALTTNCGKTWASIKHKKPFFGSCVRFRNKDDIFITGHDGTFRYTIKNKNMEEVKDSSGETLKFNTLRISSTGKTIWLAGQNGRIALIKNIK